jgi:hypothetical protein
MAHKQPSFDKNILRRELKKYKKQGLSKQAVLALVEDIWSDSNQNVLTAVSDPLVQRILNRLQECNLLIPQEFPPIPENPDLSKFVHLVYIDPTISLEQLVSAIKVNGKTLTNYLNLSETKDVEKTPNGPYFVWMQDGHLYKGKSPNQAIALFSSNERGATVREGLFLILYYPEILMGHFIDLPGSRCHRGNVPGLSGWFGDPRLRAYYVYDAFSNYGSASA